MKKYRKKPIVVQAEQFFPTKTTWPENVLKHKKTIYNDKKRRKESIDIWKIHTHNGASELHPGDWLIMGTGNKCYRCYQNDFNETYEEVEED